MYSVRSTQKLQTLRWARFGLASRGGIFGFLLLLNLERDLVRVDVAGGVLGHRRQVVAAGTVRHADGGAPRLEELDVGRHHLGRLPLLTVLSAPVAVGRDRELAHRVPLGRVPDLRVARQAAHQHDFVEAGHLALYSSACSASPASSAGLSAVTAAAVTGSLSASVAGSSPRAATSGRAAEAAAFVCGLRTIRCRNTLSEILRVASISG